MFPYVLQVPGLNILNTLLSSTAAPSLPHEVISDRTLVQRGRDLLEERRLLVAGKTILFLSLLLPLSADLLAYGCEQGVLSRYVRIGSEAAGDVDNKEYVQQCQAVMQEALVQAAATLTDEVCMQCLTGAPCCLPAMLVLVCAVIQSTTQAHMCGDHMMCSRHGLHVFGFKCLIPL